MALLDLPPETLLKRKMLKPITDHLKTKNVRFRWSPTLDLIVARDGAQYRAKDIPSGHVLLEALELPFLQLECNTTSLGNGVNALLLLLCLYCDLIFLITYISQLDITIADVLQILLTCQGRVGAGRKPVSPFSPEFGILSQCLELRLGWAV